MSGDYYRACAGCDSPCGCPLTAPRPESGGQQQAAAEDVAAVGEDYLDHGVWVEHIVAALAEAARPGQELRERVLRLADEPPEPGHSTLWLQGRMSVITRLRAALEDPR